MYPLSFRNVKKFSDIPLFCLIWKLYNWWLRIVLARRPVSATGILTPKATRVSSVCTCYTNCVAQKRIFKICVIKHKRILLPEFSTITSVCQQCPVLFSVVKQKKKNVFCTISFADLQSFKSRGHYLVRRTRSGSDKSLLIKIESLILMFTDQHSMIGSSAEWFVQPYSLTSSCCVFAQNYQLPRPMRYHRTGVDHWPG